MNSQNKINLALVQFDPVWEAVEPNLKKLEILLSDLPNTVDIVILPEAFATGFSMDAEKVAESMNGQSVTWMKRMAAEKQFVVCGSLFIVEEGNYYNRFVWVNKEGDLLTYDKRHLFSMGVEDANYSKGKQQLIIEYKGWRIFPQICYDLRFPVWSRNVHQYDLLINVANWPASRRKVWKTLLKARAIENQCYVAAVNRLGEDGNSISYSGDSLGIDYKGEVISKMKNREGIELFMIDRQNLKKFKIKFDTLKDGDRYMLID